MFARGTANNFITTFGVPPQLNSLGWLRLTRTNNTYRSYFSSNGVTWFQLGGIVTNVFADPVKATPDGKSANANIRNVAVPADPFGAA